MFLPSFSDCRIFIPKILNYMVSTVDCATGNTSYLLCFVDLPVKLRHTFQSISSWFHLLKLETVHAPTTA